jgi:PAS domain S-box-containing protein
VSTVTALALWPLFPRALKIPRVGELQAAIASLEAEVGRRRSAEDHLRDSERSLTVTLASIDAGFLATDAEGRIIRLNEVAERITGRTQAEARGRSLWQVLDREDRPVGWLQRNPVQVAQSLGTSIDIARYMWARSRRGVRTLVEVRTAVTHDEPASGADDAGALRGLVEEMGQTDLAEPDADGDEARQRLCADIDGFSLHAAVRVEAHDRKRLEQLCRCITRPALANKRVQTNAAGQVVLKLKTPWRDGTTHLAMSPLEFIQRHNDWRLCGSQIRACCVGLGSAASVQASGKQSAAQRQTPLAQGLRPLWCASPTVMPIAAGLPGDCLMPVSVSSLLRRDRPQPLRSCR